MRQGIDIDAICGQLKAAVQKKEQEQLEVESENAMLKLKNVPNEHELASLIVSNIEPGRSVTGAGLAPIIGVYWYDEDDNDNDSFDSNGNNGNDNNGNTRTNTNIADYLLENEYTERIRKTTNLTQGSNVEFEFYDAVNLDDDGDFEDEPNDHDLHKQV